MQRYTLSIQPQTAFATPLKGDTLFGQACWLIRHCYGEATLTQLLTAYTDKQPFMVVADATPQGYIPRPTVPLSLLGFDIGDPQQRKQLKAKKWLPEAVLSTPLQKWHQAALSDSEMLQQMGESGDLFKTGSQMHNSLNRKTGTTGSDAGFAPFQRHITWYHPHILLNIIVEIDSERFSMAQLQEIFTLMGAQGYGKEASCGLGKFSLQAITQTEVIKAQQADAFLSLAPCAPQGQLWQTQHCYYQIFTRFGRHGDLAVHSGKPFKNPILMADSYALFTPQTWAEKSFCGQGLHGISKAIPDTVQQGYAPIHLINRGSI